VIHSIRGGIRTIFITTISVLALAASVGAQERLCDSVSIDQIVLSPDTFLTTAPGAQKLDSVILPRQGGV
jgi:hypothetical protein